MKQNIILLSGDSQSGKTTLLQSFCNKYHNTGGILSPVVNDKRVFFNIRTQEIFDMQAKEGEEQLCVGKYIFSVAAFAKAANQLIAASIQSENDYIIVDEVGPLEINLKQGFYAALKKVITPGFNKSLILVVRPSLVAALQLMPGLQNSVMLSIKECKDYFRL